MSRWPVLPTIAVGAACTTMMALGVWQLDRRSEKEALITRYAENRALSAEIAFPETQAVPDTALFRRSQIMCLEPVSWEKQGGRSASGKSGFRNIAHCRSGVEGPGIAIDVGVSKDPRTNPVWKGGLVSGIIGLEPSSASVLSRMLGKAPPPRALLVATVPAPGLEASEPPSPDDVPNNHLAYAVQWFLFAGIAALIYLLALKRRKTRV
jgi:surfeit locus 1 family protein